MHMSLPLADQWAQFLGPLAAQPGVVAVSGGPDSVALALLFRQLQRQHRLGPLIFAHLNHRLRGADSDADEAFVAELAARWAAEHPSHIHFCSAGIDVAAEAKAAGSNLENTARRLRYDWLVQTARAHGASWIATGHTADDQAETVLHRLLRGTGLHGLAGIPARREAAHGIQLLRPLLATRRADLVAFLKQHHQAFRTDSSNDDLRLTRNRIRHKLLPHLADEYNASIVDVLCRLAEQARQAQELIETQACQLLQAAELPRAGDVVVLALAPLQARSRHVVRELFRLLWERESWPQGDMDYGAWDCVAGVALGESAALDLPHGVSARRADRVIQIGRK